jgi:hypothetical protein
MTRDSEALTRGIEGETFDTITRREDFLMNMLSEFWLFSIREQ